MGATVGIGGTSDAPAARAASATPKAIGAPAADGCHWCYVDPSDTAFGEFAFRRGSFMDRPFRRRTPTGRSPFGPRFFHSAPGFDVGTRRFGWRGYFRPAPRPYGVRRGPGGFGGRGYGAGSLDNQVYVLTNRERIRAGCGRLRFDDALGGAARNHSQDMAAYQYMNHMNHNNADPGLRMERSGYPVQYGWAENIAYGSRTAEQVMGTWMMSPGHRNNILNCRFRAIGVGVARARNGTLYWTQNFGGR